MNQTFRQTAERFLSQEDLQMEIYGKSSTQITGKLRNISQTGANIEILQGEFNLQKGDLIRGTVHLETIGKTRAFDAEVVWNSPTKIGVCFMKKNELFQKMLAKTLL